MAKNVYYIGNTPNTGKYILKVACPYCGRKFQCTTAVSTKAICLGCGKLLSIQVKERVDEKEFSVQ